MLAFSADDSQVPAGQVPAEIQSAGTEFLDAETGGRESVRETIIVGRDRELKNWRQESPQKRPLFDRRQFPRFGRTGWWRRSGPNWLLPTQGSNQVSETRVRNGIFCCKGHTFESCRVRHFSFVLQRDMRDPTKTPAPAHSSESAI